MNTICINGAPLLNKVTGIERYLIEILKRLDRLNQDNQVQIDLLVPQCNTDLLPHYSNINIVQLKSEGSRLKFKELRSYIKSVDGVYVSLSSNFCVKRGSIICLHDIRPLILKKGDPFLYRIKYMLVCLSIKLFAKKIITVSETSKSEICKYLKIDTNKIDVISNGWEQIIDISPDYSIFERNNKIIKGEYYYSLSSRAPHKNFKWIEETAKNNKKATFVIGGKKWKENNEIHNQSNVIYLGYVTDEENKALMQNCKAFLHPSKYEGFGLTPLEALACGAEICISNASCLPEIFGNCARYFDPDDYNVDLDKLLENPVNPPEMLMQKYSWDKAAQMWYELLLTIVE